MFSTIATALSTGLSFIQIIRQMLPEVIALVNDVQTAFAGSESVTTKQKVDHVEGILQAALEATNGLPVSVDKLLPALVALAASHLDALNPAPATAPQGA